MALSPLHGQRYAESIGALVKMRRSLRGIEFNEAIGASAAIPPLVTALAGTNTAIVRTALSALVRLTECCCALPSALLMVRSPHGVVYGVAPNVAVIRDQQLLRLIVPLMQHADSQVRMFAHPTVVVCVRKYFA